MENGDQTVLMLALRQEVTFGGELRPRVYGCFRGSERHCRSIMNRGGWTVSANSRQCLIQHYPSMFFTIAKTTTTTVLIMPQKIATSVITVACARVSRDVLSKSSFIAVSSHK